MHLTYYPDSIHVCTDGICVTREAVLSPSSGHSSMVAHPLPCSSGPQLHPWVTIVHSKFTPGVSAYRSSFYSVIFEDTSYAQERATEEF